MRDDKQAADKYQNQAEVRPIAETMTDELLRDVPCGMANNYDRTADTGCGISIHFSIQGEHRGQL